MGQSRQIRVAVLGATGYTGAELLRLVRGHPGIVLSQVAGHGKAGLPIEKVLPSLVGLVSGTVDAIDPERVAASSDAAFCALPHGASAKIVKELRQRGVVVFDLSADFRLSDRATYERWYAEHPAPELLEEAVYGLCELYRDRLRTADLVAVPGCYPTAAALALAPLVRAGLLELGTLVVDAKSGASGAGRGLSEAAHFAHLAEGLRAYKVAGLHRHTPEIEQTLAREAGGPVTITFTPHLVPMIRGILATCYASLRDSGTTAERCVALARDLYEGSPSAYVLDAGTNPDTSWVRGSNRCLISYSVDQRSGRLVAQAVIDNLVKGAAGQALQCFNLRFGFEEQTALDGAGLFP